MLKTFYSVCLSFMIIGTDVVRCNFEYSYNSEAGGWLKLHSIPATWEEAYLRCHYEGAVLASPLNKELAKALHSQMSEFGDNYRIFLGINDLYYKGLFTSVEGVPLSVMEIKWRSHHLGAKAADCLTMSVNENQYYTDTSLCNDTLPYMCYRKYDNQTMNEGGTFDDEYHFKRHTGSCYKIHRETQTWNDAYKICASEGGHLVILNDAEEARIIKDMIYDSIYQIHVGLRAWSKDRIWTTIHGERFESVFHEWDEDQNDNDDGIEDRGSFYKDGHLYDVAPTYKSMFICEKSPTTKQFEPVRLTEKEVN